MSGQIKCDQCGTTVPSESIGNMIGWLSVTTVGVDTRAMVVVNQPRQLHFCRPEHLAVYFVNKYGTTT